MKVISFSNPLDPSTASEDDGLDLDDKNYDSIREQAEQLGLLKYVTGEADFELTEEDPQSPAPSTVKSAIKKKKRIEDDIEKLKIQKYNKIREYNHLKKRKHGHHYGDRSKDASPSSTPVTKDLVLRNKKLK